MLNFVSLYYTHVHGHIYNRKLYLKQSIIVTPTDLVPVCEHNLVFHTDVSLSMHNENVKSSNI